LKRNDTGELPESFRRSGTGAGSCRSSRCAAASSTPALRRVCRGVVAGVKPLRKSKVGRASRKSTVLFASGEVTCGSTRSPGWNGRLGIARSLRGAGGEGIANCALPSKMFDALDSRSDNAMRPASYFCAVLSSPWPPHPGRAVCCGGFCGRCPGVRRLCLGGRGCGEARG
jgi:hypothetical protein